MDVADVGRRDRAEDVRMDACVVVAGEADWELVEPGGGA
jgi:hypothetical protein